MAAAAAGATQYRTIETDIPARDGPVALVQVALLVIFGLGTMIAGTYIVSGILLVVTGLLFRAGTLDATTQTIGWCVIFFFASAGASAAYLTVRRPSRWRPGRWRSRSPTRRARSSAASAARCCSAR